MSIVDILIGFVGEVRSGVGLYMPCKREKSGKHCKNMRKFGRL